jgi:lysozyme family protein
MAGQNPFDTPLYASVGRYAVVGPHVLGIEGGLANVPGDHGGLTKYGCSLPWLQDEAKVDPLVAQWFDLDGDGQIDAGDIEALTPQQVLNLFFHCIWCRELHLDLAMIPPTLDGAVFDQAVNDGPAAAIKLLQTSINTMLVGVNLAVDGNFGPKSLTALNTALGAGDPASALGRLLSIYRSAAEARYRAIVAERPDQGEFLGGWVARARSLGNV